MQEGAPPGRSFAIPIAAGPGSPACGLNPDRSRAYLRFFFEGGLNGGTVIVMLVGEYTVMSLD